MEAKEIQPQLNIISKIKDLKLIECKIVDTVPAILVGKLDKDKVQFEFNFGIRLDIVKKSISIILDTNIYADEAKTINLGVIKSEGEFEVQNLDEILSTFENKIPNLILANFIGVLVGTTRGFLVDKSKSTILEGIFLPMIHPLNLFPQQTEIKS